MTAAITALMGGVAYLASAEIAANGNDLVAAGMLRDERAGSFPGYLRNREPSLGVIRRHRAVAETNLGQRERSISYGSIAIGRRPLNQSVHRCRLWPKGARRQHWSTFPVLPLKTAIVCREHRRSRTHRADKSLPRSLDRQGSVKSLKTSTTSKTVGTGRQERHRRHENGSACHSFLY